MLLPKKIILQLKTKGKGVLFNVVRQRKPESLFPVESTAGVFTSPAPSLG